MLSLIAILWLYIWGVVMAYDSLTDAGPRTSHWTKAETGLLALIILVWPVAFPVIWVAEKMGVFDD